MSPANVLHDGIYYERAQWSWPRVGVREQYREAVPTESRHAYLLTDGSFVVDHVDAFNPDKGHALEHWRADVDPTVSGDFFRDVSHLVKDTSKGVAAVAKGTGALATGHFKEAARQAKELVHDVVSVTHDVEPILHVYEEVLSQAQAVISLIPGVGTGISSAIGTALQILHGGGPLEIALRAAYDAIPIPPGIKWLTDVVFDAVIALLRTKSLVEAAIAAARSKVPKGLPQQVFDTLVHVIVGALSKKATRAAVKPKPGVSKDAPARIRFVPKANAPIQATKPLAVATERPPERVPGAYEVTIVDPVHGPVMMR